MWVRNKFTVAMVGTPLLWSGIGFTAVFLSGIIEDAGLILTGMIALVAIILHNKKTL